MIDDWWCPKKALFVIFTYKQSIITIDMKTKVVLHVESAWIREWKSESVRECECERETFEYRHENKSCPSCREWECERVREFSWFPAFVWRSDIFYGCPNLKCGSLNWVLMSAGKAYNVNRETGKTLWLYTDQVVEAMQKFTDRKLTKSNYIVKDI